MTNRELNISFDNQSLNHNRFAMFPMHHHLGVFSRDTSNHSPWGSAWYAPIWLKTPSTWLPVLNYIPPPDLRRRVTFGNEYDSILKNHILSVRGDLEDLNKKIDHGLENLSEFIALKIRSNTYGVKVVGLIFCGL